MAIGIAGAMLGSALIGGASAVGSSLLSSSANKDIASDANSAAAFANDIAWKRSRIAAKTAFRRNKSSSALAYRREKSLFKHRFQYAVSDLRKAGLNPILAASSGFNVGSSPNISAAQAPMAQVQQRQTFAAAPPDYGALAGSARDVAEASLSESKMENIEADTAKKIEESVLVQNEAMNALEKVYLTRAQAKLTTAQEKQTWQNIKNLKQDLQVKVAEVSKIYAEFRELNTRSAQQQTEMLLMDEQRKVLTQTYEQIRSKTEALKANLVRMQKISDVYNIPVLGHFLAGVESLFGSVGKLLSGNASVTSIAK